MFLAFQAFQKFLDHLFSAEYHIPGVPNLHLEHVLWQTRLNIRDSFVHECSACRTKDAQAGEENSSSHFLDGNFELSLCQPSERSEKNPINF